MRLAVTTNLPCPLAEAADQVHTSRLMKHVSWPLTIFSPLVPAELPVDWSPGSYRVSMRALWVVPLGAHDIVISLPTPPAPDYFLIRDNGSGQLIRRWDHLITMQAEGPAVTRYTDEVDIEAGALTVPVWVWAHGLYRWRQFRWRRLAARSFRY